MVLRRSRPSSTDGPTEFITPKIFARSSPRSRGTRSPFALVDGTHTARWFVVDDMVSEAIPVAKIISTRSISSSSPTSTALSRSSSRLWSTTIPDVIDSVWSHCVGCPGLGKPLAVLDYIRDCQVNTTLYFGGYPGATVQAALRALLMQRSMIRFVEESRIFPRANCRRPF